MSLEIGRLPFVAFFYKSSQAAKKGIEKSPYPDFFRNLIKNTEAIEGKKPKKAIILEKGFKAETIRLFIKAVWGGKVLNAIKSIANERKPINKELKDKIGADIDTMNNGVNIGSDSFRTSPKKEGETVMASLPNGLLNKLREEGSKTPKASSSEIAAAHLAAIVEKGSACNDIRAGDGNPWRAIRVSMNEDGIPVARQGTACPTSERALSVSNDLTNIYFHVSTDGHLTITCGVIDTEKKAEQFMAAVAEALKYRDTFFPGLNIPLRISMHQLNSMGSGPGVIVSERSLVKRQHQMVDYINQNLEDYLKSQSSKGVTFTGKEPYVAHVNRCLNGFTQIKGEDANAHPVNREGLAIQMNWLHQDVRAQMPARLNPIEKDYDEKMRLMEATLMGIQKKRKDLTKAQFEYGKTSPLLRDIKKALEETEGQIINTQIKMLDLPVDAEDELTKLRITLIGLEDARRLLIEEMTPNQAQVEKKIKKLENEIKELDVELKKQLQDLAGAMHEYQKYLEGKIQENPHDQAIEDLHLKIQVGTHILAMQTGMLENLGLPHLNAAQELGYQLVFDLLLNLITEINCKSGLDRTGFLRSLLNAILQKIKKGESLGSIIKFLNEFDGKVKAMDKAVNERLRENPSFRFDEWINGEGKTYKDVYEFQVAVFAELMGVACPITARSTGFRGVKWHHDKDSINPFEKNPHPVPFIPMFIIADGKFVQLMQTDKKGQRKFTSDGNALLMGLSARRGG